MRIGPAHWALAWVASALSVVSFGTVAGQESIPVTVRLQDAAGASRSLPQGGRVTAHRDGSTVEVALDPESMQVLLPGSGHWRLCLAAEALWSRCRSVDIAPSVEGEPAASALFTLWPSASLRGRVRTAEDNEVPAGLSESLRVFAGPPPGRRPTGDFRDSELDCSLDDDGGFVCPVPATPLYAAVRLSGFVSRYFWEVAPAPGSTVDLGTVRLERGASLAGEVDLQAPGVQGDLVEIRLTPTVGPESGAAVTASLAKDARTSRVTPAGFFQFGGIRPGSYMLVVQHPSFATTELGPFEVFDGKETRLRDSIRLLPPVDVSLQIQPALSPLGRPWRVEVFRRRDWSGGSDRVFSGAADPAGALEIAAQTPGVFEVRVEDEEGNRFHATTATIEPGGSGFVPITVPIVGVRGTVRLGSEPLRATLRFGGTHGALRSRMTTDEEGAYSGTLPRDGEWTVEVEAADPSLDTVRRVEVDAGEDGEAELDIELDNTELLGRVVTRDGLPVPDAQIKLTALSEMVTKRSTSDENGEFRFRALPAGQVMLSASGVLEGRQTTSAPTKLTLEEEIPLGPVELVLEPLHSFSGHVSSSTRPVPAAQVYATSIDLPVPAVGSAVSDADGAFVLELPVGDGLVAFTVLPPGGYLSTSIQRLENPLHLRSSSAGGTLTIDITASEGGDWFLTVQREGVGIALPLLARWARGHGVQVSPPRSGEPMTFPRLAEGSYRVCMIDEAVRRRRLQEGASWQQIDAEATRCVAGTLAPGGTLELSLDGE